MLETDEGDFLAESGATPFYLSEDTPFLPEGRLGRARVLRWMFLEQGSHEPNIATPRCWATHGIEMTGERRLSLGTRRRLGRDALGVMEGHLRQNDFFVGGRHTLADVTGEGGFGPAGYPAVRAWIGRAAAQPGHVPTTHD